VNFRAKNTQKMSCFVTAFMLNLPQGDGLGLLHQRGGACGSSGLLEAECPPEASFSEQLSRILKRVDN
jgi:hypothetical protein